VSPLRNLILNNGVGGHFAATLAARPVLGGGEQLLPDSLAPVAFLDIPSLDVADWPRRVAAVSMGAQSSFEKSSGSSATKWTSGRVDGALPSRIAASS